MTIWQIAAGDSGRDYSRLFLKHDLAFLGPGRFGEYKSETYQELKMSGAKVGPVKAFCRDVQPGDIMLLRRGCRVKSLGIVPDDGEGYVYDSTFDDVYGWDLEYTRRVILQEHLTQSLQDIQAKGPLFSASRMNKFSPVKNEKVLKRLCDLCTKCESRPLKPRPEALPEPLSPEELGEALFAKGLANDAVEHVLRAIKRQRRLLRAHRQRARRRRRGRKCSGPLNARDGYYAGTGNMERHHLVLMNMKSFLT